MGDSILSDWADTPAPIRAEPSRPGLDLAGARRAALSQLRGRLRREPDLVAAFWAEIASPDRISTPDATVLYAQLGYAGKSYTILEFVSGETLEQFVKRADPAECESAIPLFCRVLDAFEEAERKPNGLPLAPSSFADSGVALHDFGICRVTAECAGRAYGTLLFTPGGLSPEEIVREDHTSRAEVVGLMLAVQQSLGGHLPVNMDVSPAKLADIFIAPLHGRQRRLELPEAAQAAVREPAAPSRRGRFYVPTPVIAFVTAVLLLVALFGSAQVVSQFAPRQSAMSLPQFPPLPAELAADEAAKPAPDRSVIPITVTSETPAAPKTAPVRQTVATNRTPALPAASASQTPVAAGLTRGAKLLSSPELAYPEKAKDQRVSGVVRLEVLVDEDGTVKQPRILSGHPLLRAGLVDAVRHWMYQPALLNGKPVPMTAEIEIKFNLDRSRP